MNLRILLIFLPVILYALLFAIQYFLSKTGNKILGGIVPVLFIVALVVLYSTDKIDLNIWGTIILGVIGLIMLLNQWDNAQKDNKKKKQKELDKMIGKDLK